MLDERAFIEQVEAANADELGELLAHPASEEQRALRVHLGPERYQRMHSLALRRSRAQRANRMPRGNVIVIPGIMGSQLTAYDRDGNADRIWINPVNIVNGRLDRLRLDDDGRSEATAGCDVRATGILKRYYGELLLSLSERWTVRAFWYDWRRSIDDAAAELSSRVQDWFGDEPAHIVAHGMGGLVARAFIRDDARRWRRMQDPALVRGGRLIMLGVPNRGSFSIPPALFGLDATLDKLERLDLRHNKEEIQQIFTSFVGTYEMLPEPAVPGADRLYEAATYDTVAVPPARLKSARDFHTSLRGVADAARMICVLGSNRPTLCGIKAGRIRPDKLAAYEVTLDGDGRVTHALGRLEDRHHTEVRTYYIDEDHGGLSSNRKLLDALEDLLESGTTNDLPERPEDLRSDGRPSTTKADARLDLASRATEESGELETLLGRSSRWRDLRRTKIERGGAGASMDGDPFLSAHEREIEEILTRGELGSRTARARKEPSKVPFGPAEIEIRVVGDAIERVGATAPADGDPIDVIAVGHYLGVRPEGAELALDRAISLSSQPGSRARRSVEETAELLLTQFSQRGILPSGLGQPFFLVDPRQRASTGGTPGERIIAIVGMGPSGRFGEAQLAVVARELCWAVGRMGKRHLATVLIGAGNGNLPAREATLAWLRGIKSAVTGTDRDDPRRLRRVTFVESSPGKFRAIHQAIADEQIRLSEEKRLGIDFVPLTDDELDKVTDALAAKRRQDPDTKVDSRDPEAPPTRLTVTIDNGGYLFGAITSNASIPERRIDIDRDLVDSANDDLAAMWDADAQIDRGRYLEQLLLPDELRGQVYSPTPLVLMLDTATARIHWEMIALSDPDLVGARDDDDGHLAQIPGAEDFDSRRFLGTSRGLTRQLRATFAPPPDPTPPPRRLLRVLVVADPAEDAPLPGAEEEGEAIANLFERFNDIYTGVSDNRVEVVRLLGPQEATRNAVLRELTNRSYDVLHFAGHCVYDKDNPRASGWIFSHKERITAAELDRVDRVPAFVFSNACESGITRDRSTTRSAELAPTFAETFFRRNVSNFVCTAWPVNDQASELFARTLYQHLLGMVPSRDRPGRVYSVASNVMPMHVAMRQARLATAVDPNGSQSWGAYQHYGNPYMYLFDPRTMKETRKRG
jgi:hypothetical protein